MKKGNRGNDSLFEIICVKESAELYEKKDCENVYIINSKQLLSGNAHLRGRK